MRKYRLLIVSFAIVTLAIGALVAVLILPTVKKISKLRELIDTERVTIEERYFHRQKVRKTIEYMTEIKRDLPALRALALERGREVALVETIENLAQINGLEEKIRLIPPQSGPTDYNRKLVVELNLTGEARAVGKFLTAIELIDPLFNVTTLDVQGTDKDGVVVVNITGWIAWPEPTLDRH